MNKVPINSTIRPELKEKAKQVANDRGLSLSAYIDIALTTLIKKDENN